MNKSTLDPQQEWIIKACEAVGSPEISSDTVAAARRVWFRNPLNHNSLRLTLSGFNWFTKKSNFTCHRINLESSVNGKQMLQLEQLFTAPYYILQTNITIQVFSDVDAVMLQLHAGDLKQYLNNLSSNE